MTDSPHRDTFATVREAADRGGQFMGADDYLDRDRQLELALQQLGRLHHELNRVLKVSASAEQAVKDAVARSGDDGGVDRRGGAGRRARFVSARARLRAGKLTTRQFIKVVFWIVLKSGRVDRAQPVGDVIAGVTWPSSVLFGSGALQGAIESSRYDEAHVWARALLPRHRANPRFLSLVRQIQVKRGSLSLVLATDRMLQQLERRNDDGARRTEGRLREVSGWIPLLPGPNEVIEPRNGSTVLHLVKESRPYLSNGFTSRSHRSFLAERDAGLTPVVMTEPGFLRRVGAEPVEGGWVDGVEHIHTELGPSIDGLSSDLWLSAYAQAALDVVRRVRPAVIHVSSGRRGYDTALIALALKEKTGIPVVYEVRSFFEGTWTAEVEQEQKGELFLRRLATEQMCIDRADLVLTLGLSMRDELVRRGADPSKIEIVPNGVDLSQFSPVTRDSALSQTLDLGDVPTFGYVSNMDHPRESQETLIEAASLLKAWGVQATCVLVGDGPRRPDLEALAREIGVEDRVVFAGSVDHTAIARYYSLIDVFVVPRMNERASRFVTPLKPFEAMALAKPLIVSDLPALREIADPPRRGLSFRAGDAQHLAHVLRSLMADPIEQERLGRAGRAWVANERQWSHNSNRYAEAYSRVVPGFGRGAA